MEEGHGPPPIALTIAGSDSGGGAGIQADLRTFHAFGVYGTTALTAVTAQNTLGVEAVEILPASLIRAQIHAVCRDLPPAAVKSGMLGDALGVDACARAIEELGLENYVLDPVMVATSGDRLLEPEAVGALGRRLLPLATLVTPNLPEAALLTGLEPHGEDGMREVAGRLVDAGAGAALIKGGHLEGADVIDLFWDGRSERVWRRPRIASLHTHGTGCTLSAAITAGLARGTALTDAIDAAIGFTRRAIVAAPGLGGGRGPLNHWVEPG